jgi:hypothetical protein
MKLFHAFPRPRHHNDAEGYIVRDPPTPADQRRALEVLRLILTHGLLCTPERFKLYPNYETENEEKLKFLRAKTHHDEIVQSRACFTLLNTLELTERHETREAAHADLFGEFAIGLDPLEARDLGIAPTVYYYRNDLGAGARRTAGLGSQIVERLDEIRSVFSVLSYIEAQANVGVDEVAFPPAGKLREMGIQIRFQKEIEDAVKRLTSEQAALIFKLFNTDRVPSWNLVDFIEIMLSLYQTTDSTIEDAPLAFFHQREWRLVHHMMPGLIWFGLGNQSARRDPWAAEFHNDRREIRNYLRCGSQKSESDMARYFDHCWVLAGTETRLFRDFVRQIVVPERFCQAASDLIRSIPFESAPPEITPLPARWRIVTENGIPRITQSA